MTELSPFKEKRLLMVPGPVEVHPRVLRAMSQPMIGHLDPDFVSLLDEILDMLRRVFQTKGDVIILTGSGTSAMEAAVGNVIEKGDKVLSVVSGLFGRRFAEIARRRGAEVHEVKFPLGSSADPSKIKEELESGEYKALTVVHCETSTGALNPIEEIAKACRDEGVISIVDGITSVGGIDVRTEEWGIDLLVVGSQKCLAAPPGLAMLSVSERAWECIENRKEELPDYYLDLLRNKGYMVDRLSPRRTPFTPGVPALLGLYEALKLIEEEGLENRFERHRLIGEGMRESIKAIGLELFPEEGAYSNTLTSFKVPKGIEDKELRGRMKEKYGVIVAGGLEELTGKIVRIGHMGISAVPQNVFATVSALECALHEMGFKLELGSGISALEDVFLRNNL